ncbi:MAG: DUF2829 domain-containing protein [Gammaproteobacteria bacterium]|nr:DUF2829 domain-containing protein [Gammaproteobacteria bacterium]
MFDFGQAITEMKSGAKVARAGWNGKGMWLMLVEGSTHASISPTSAYGKQGLTESVVINPHIDMMTAQGFMQPGWLASQTDMLAEDWSIVE